MDEQRAPRLLFTVLLVNGGRIVHTYEAPSDLNEALNFLDTMCDMIAEVLIHRAQKYFLFSNPSICYNPDHVLGVEFKAVGAAELDKAGREALRKRMDLIKD